LWNRAATQVVELDEFLAGTSSTSDFDSQDIGETACRQVRFPAISIDLRYLKSHLKQRGGSGR
jgi:hypothetical protein